MVPPTKDSPSMTARVAVSTPRDATAARRSSSATCVGFGGGGCAARRGGFTRVSGVVCLCLCSVGCCCGSSNMSFYDRSSVSNSCRPCVALMCVCVCAPLSLSQPSPCGVQSPASPSASHSQQQADLQTTTVVTRHRVTSQHPAQSMVKTAPIFTLNAATPSPNISAHQPHPSYLQSPPVCHWPP